MSTEFKRVSAIDKCFDILDLFSRTGESLGISEISRLLGLNKSTVFNTIHTLTDLNVLEKTIHGKFTLGTRLYTLGNTSGLRSQLIQTVRPYLETINKKIKLSAFLGIRSGLSAIIVDKVDSAHDIKISSEVGMSLPLLAGAGGKALLCQLPDKEIDKILSENRLKKFTPNTNTSKNAYKKELLKVRKDGIALDREEYIKEIVAIAVPLSSNRKDLQAAIWVAGLKHQVTEDLLPGFKELMKDIAMEINHRFSKTA